MGKKRIATQSGTTVNQALKARSLSKASRKKVVEGILFIDATFNNTKVSLTDKGGNVIFWSSTGMLGFKGAKKGTPFAALKAGDLIGEKAAALGIKDVSVVVKGVGAGREPVIRSFMTHGIGISSIEDKTPIPHNGPRPRKPRRV